MSTRTLENIKAYLVDDIEYLIQRAKDAEDFEQQEAQNKRRGTTIYDVEEAIREAERLLGRYRYDMRPYSDPRQKKLATAENLLTEARTKLMEQRTS